MNRVIIFVIFELSRDFQSMSTKDVNVLIATANSGTYELVFNSSFSLLNKDDLISVDLGKGLFNWTIHITFYDNNLQEPGTSELTTNDKIKNLVTINNNRWYSDDWIEITNPHEIKSQDGQTHLLVKLRSKANNVQNFRVVEVTIWKKLK